MSKLNNQMRKKCNVSKHIFKVLIICTIMMLISTIVTTLAVSNSNKKLEDELVKNISIEENLDENLLVEYSSMNSENLEILTLEEVQGDEREITVENMVDNESILNVETENNVEKINNVQENEILVTVNEYWPVTVDQLTAYFGYVPEEWELAYWEATIMAECRGEPEEGIKAVADCIGYIRTNIDDRFPNTIYGVITQKNQFSTWKNGAIDKWLGNTYDNVHSICVNQIQNGASYNAAFFTAGRYNKYCTPGFVIGNHYFGY